MTVLFVLAGFGVVLAVALLAVGRLGELAPVTPDRAPLDLPEDRPLDRADVDGVRFAVGFRGYRMDEVDDMLDRLASDLAVRDARITALEAAVTPPGNRTVAPGVAAAEPVANGVTGPAEAVAGPDEVVAGPDEVVAEPATAVPAPPDVPAPVTAGSPDEVVTDEPSAPVGSGSVPPPAPPAAPWLAAEAGADAADPGPAGGRPDRPAD